MKMSENIVRTEGVDIRILNLKLESGTRATHLSLLKVLDIPNLQQNIFFPKSWKKSNKVL